MIEKEKRTRADWNKEVASTVVETNLQPNELERIASIVRDLATELLDKVRYQGKIAEQFVIQRLKSYFEVEALPKTPLTTLGGFEVMVSTDGSLHINNTTRNLIEVDGVLEYKANGQSHFIIVEVKTGKIKRDKNRGAWINVFTQSDQKIIIEVIKNLYPEKNIKDDNFDWLFIVESGQFNEDVPTRNILEQRGVKVSHLPFKAETVTELIDSLW